MMMCSDELLLGYDYDAWHGYGKKVPIYANITQGKNRHMLIAGVSGGGKSYLTNQLMARLLMANGKEQIMLFADFKREDAFEYIRGCKNYYYYEQTIEALDIVYSILHKRQSGEDKSRIPVTLFFDEYLAAVLALKSKDKKKADKVMMQVAEILSIGRSLNCTICITTQTAYASVFPEGSRNNFGIIAICGAPLRSIYELLVPREYIDDIVNKNFSIGEGIVLLQGRDMHCIKVPMVKNEEIMKDIIVEGLNN